MAAGVGVAIGDDDREGFLGGAQVPENVPGRELLKRRAVLRFINAGNSASVIRPRPAAIGVPHVGEGSRIAPPNLGHLRTTLSGTLVCQMRLSQQGSGGWRHDPSHTHVRVALRSAFCSIAGIIAAILCGVPH